MTDAWSISDGYADVSGHWHDTRPDVRAALAAALPVASSGRQRS